MVDGECTVWLRDATCLLVEHLGSAACYCLPEHLLQATSSSATCVSGMACISALGHWHVAYVFFLASYFTAFKSLCAVMWRTCEFVQLAGVDCMCLVLFVVCPRQPPRLSGTATYRWPRMSD